ncbi:hypothetical protein [Burkholderia phage FLC9]|nr:hypothetical protein [Burkholderia phage FLC9]
MGPLIQFLTNAFTDHVFAEEHTAEQLYEKLTARPDCATPIATYLRHSDKVSLLNLSVVEVLSGQRTREKEDTFGLDYLQKKVLARPVTERIEVIMRHARTWDDLRERAAAA